MRLHILAVLLFVLPAWPQYDVLITGGRVVDGAGNPWFIGDVAIQGDTIAAVGHLGGAPARLKIDARGLVVAPGFLDIHTHARRGIFGVPAAENYLRQGVTTLLEGPDGSSPVPLAPFLAKLEKTSISVNFGLLVGQGSIREKVVGLENRSATPGEIQQMKELARQAMLEGAFGLSTGLFYVPGNYTPTEEVIEIARVVGRMGGVHISHMRNEAEGVLDSVRETIRIGEEGGLPTQITHHKIIGRENWGRSGETLRLVEEARARGVDVTIDQYPYTASSTGTAALFPQWAQAGGRKALLERLAAPEQRARIKTAIVRGIRDDRGGGDPKNVVLAACSFDPSLAGKNLAELTAARGVPVTFENAADTAIEIQRKGGCQAVYHAIGEEDVERILRYPFTMIASDGGIPVFGEEAPHPRNYGTFARVLGRYVRERKTLTLEDAVRKMSSLPAARLKLWDRGLLRPGMKADLAVFDPAIIADKAEFSKPHQYAAGVKHTFVNGKPALLDGQVTAERPGRVLYGPARN
ncbi:MAG: D-aminoacylase [Acidobacteria bacterium]|nr:D-aminoacylase [Acidobacteriota bacterium]